MSGAAFDPGAKLQLHVVSQSPHTFAYKLWFALPGDLEWSDLDEGTIETPAREYGPFPARTQIAYTLLLGGNPNTDWRTQVMLSQRGALLACSPPADSGVTSAAGVARKDNAVVLR
jgi:hypothetical protein